MLLPAEKKNAVKMKHLFGNQQVTKALSKLVGTSEAIRPLVYLSSKKKFWFYKTFNAQPLFYCASARQFRSCVKAQRVPSFPSGERFPSSFLQFETFFFTSNPNSPRFSTVRLKSKSHSEVAWNQWLAGLLDGDGCFLVSSSGYTSCEITMDLRDEHALQQIKTKLGGSVKLRAGTKSIRYRLHHRKGILELLHRVNGEIRHSVRKNQFHTLCQIFSIDPLNPAPLSRKNAWFAGFFDADGTICISLKHRKGSLIPGAPQCTISVSNKKAEDLSEFQNVFAGNIYYEKSSRTFKWSIQSRESILDFLSYVKDFGPCRSSKKFRFFYLPRFFELVDLRAYRAEEGSLLQKAWIKFLERWKERGI